ncbi:MAG: CoA-binding protein, partial [Rhodobacteraceae bacterium]|nr:CoA-binding protein [Paracoccaceae bacterium]
MADGRDSAAGTRAPDIRRLLAPRSVAIIGASANAASMGARALSAFRRFGYAGDIHLVNPRTEVIDGIRCVPTVADLPEGVDAAIFAIPQPAVAEAMAQGIARGLGGAVVFSAGYAETGDAGRRAQDEMASMARTGGLALAGPNCLGLVNFDAGVPLTSGPVHPIDRRGRPGLAVIAQSGGIMGAIINASEDRDIPLSHAISTGNEATLGVSDYFAALVDDPAIGAFALFAEQVRDPRGFLAAARRARALSRPVILLHSGRSARAQEAALSHTGAVASNFRAMEAAVRAEGVLLVDGMDRLIDVSEMVSKFPVLPRKGLGIITDSGAFKGLALDSADDLGLPLPDLKAETYDKLRAATFDYVEGSNPLDVTGQAMMNLDRIYG